MPTIDATNGRITYRVLYEGLPLSGKSTSLKWLALRVDASAREPPKSYVADACGWFSFGFAPRGWAKVGSLVPWIEALTYSGARAFNRAQRWAVAGEIDAIVFVIDSQHERDLGNAECLTDTRTTLTAIGRDQDAFPWVFQYNKRDLPSAMTIEALRADLNPHCAPEFESVAVRGIGVADAFCKVMELLQAQITRDS